MTSLSVVVPATDHPPTLPDCLAALEASTLRADEVIVVEQPSTLSACEARNAGVARATGDVIVFVDADVEVHPDALERVRAAFTSDPALTAVHGSYDDVPRVRSVVSAFRNLLHHHVHQQADGPAETFWTGLGAVRRQAFLAAGGFDGDRYPHPSIEDIELGHRLLLAGGRLQLDASIQGTHLKRWTLRSMLWTDFARRAVPWVALQVRTRRVVGSLNMGWTHRISALLCVLGPALLLAGQAAAAAGAGAALVGVNRAFYRLLLQRLGLLGGVLGIGLHWLHHVVAVLAVPVGVVATLLPPRSAGSTVLTPVPSTEGIRS